MVAADSAKQGNVAEFSVSEISGLLKRTVEETFGHVRVRGEISGYRGPHASGHCYFALKDDKARLEAVIWRPSVARLKAQLKEGLEVVATGRLTTYPGTSKYQIVIEALEAAGAGALMALLEERRRKLAAEGLFDAARRKPLPFLPAVIGVITSPTGAVIRDVLHRIADRYPLHVVVWPVRVQGETCGAEVAAAIAGFNALKPGGPLARPDLLIVARGGGSIEDLWGFNDEAVVRAAAASAIPLISAVGHETDWTLIDHAADLRAPTPTGAAELAVPVKSELEARIATGRARLAAASRRFLEEARSGLRAAARGLGRPQELLAQPRQRLDLAGARLAGGLGEATRRARIRFARTGGRLAPALLNARIAQARGGYRDMAARIDAAFRQRLARRRQMLERSGARLTPQRLSQVAAQARARLEATWRLIASLSHTNILARGFALVRRAGGEPVTRVGALSPGERFRLQMQDGEIAATAEGAAGGPVRGSPTRRSKPGGQGDLF
jgi:exodeoxyribonuclease VII large subunit